MKNIFSILSIVLLILLGACDKSANEINRPDNASVQAADQALMDFGKSLKKQLIAQMEKNGVDSALVFCSLSAQNITKEVSENHPGYSFKRTSDKVRNPLNKPDIYEEEVIVYFQDQLQNTGQLPSSHLQPIELNGREFFRYYRPLKIDALCLNCHGDKTHISAAVAKKLTENYPQDEAVNYSLNEFRGLMRVEFKSDSKK